MSAGNTIVLAFLHSADCVAIKVYQDKPETMTKEEEAAWSEQSRADAFYLKGQLELDAIKIDTIMSRLILNIMPNPFTRDVSDNLIRELTEMNYSSEMETRFLNVTQKIRESVSLSKANTRRCLQLFKEHKSLTLNKLLLVAYPRCVGVIRNLRTYVGNLTAWTLSASEEVVFKAEAEKIRKEARIIYNSIKHLFEPMDQSNFWEYYIRVAMVYKSYKNQQAQLRASN